MLNVIKLNVITLSVIMLNVIMMNVITLNVIMLNVIMLNVIMLNVTMLSVAAPYFYLKIGCIKVSFCNFDVLALLSLKCQKYKFYISCLLCSFSNTRALCYKTFFVRDLRIFILS